MIYLLYTFPALPELKEGLPVQNINFRLRQTKDFLLLFEITANRSNNLRYRTHFIDLIETDLFSTNSTIHVLYCTIEIQTWIRPKMAEMSFFVALRTENPIIIDEIAELKSL